MGKNIIVIVTDSLRADYVGAYGSNVKTPNFDKLASRSTLFLKAYAESLPTMPTRTTWWLGQTNFPFRGWQPFEPTDYPLAEMLWDRGYTSCLVSDTYHMHKPIYNMNRGFDTVIWVRGQEYDPWVVDRNIKVDVSRYYRFRGDESDDFWKPRAEQYLRNISQRKSEEDYFIARVIKKAIQWLEEVTKKQKENIFFWVDCFDPHEPWDPPEPFWSMYYSDYKGLNIIDPVPGFVEGYMSDDEVKRTKSLYAGEVSFVDKWVGIFLEKVEDLGLFENSLIVWTTDHGEPFGEHGIIRKARPWNYTELVHIPFVIYHPEVGSGKKISSIVQTTDLMPTILDFLEISGPFKLKFLAPLTTGTFPQDRVIREKEVKFHGKSLIPLMSGEVEKIRDYALIGHAFCSWTIRDENWSYHLYIDGSKPPELYNISKDWWEKENVIDKEKEVADFLELKLRRAISSLTI